MSKEQTDDFEIPFETGPALEHLLELASLRVNLTVQDLTTEELRLQAASRLGAFEFMQSQVQRYRQQEEAKLKEIES